MLLISNEEMAGRSVPVSVQDIYEIGRVMLLGAARNPLTRKSTLPIVLKQQMQVADKMQETTIRPRVAILYIATGRYYEAFWESFHEACRAFFLPDCDVHYFLFTDHEGPEDADVTVVKKAFYPWPYETLRRFETFLLKEDDLREYDYIFFLNGTMLPVAPVGREILPSPEQELMVTMHPGFYGRSCPEGTGIVGAWRRFLWRRFTAKKLPYERSAGSQACVPVGKGKHYFMGGFNGGTSAAFLRLARELDAAVKRDLQEGIVAVWHDESHLNRYMLGKEDRALVLSPEYAYPEVVSFNQGNLRQIDASTIRMIVRDKSRQPQGVSWLRQAESEVQQ